MTPDLWRHYKYQRTLRSMRPEEGAIHRVLTTAGRDAMTPAWDALGIARRRIASRDAFALAGRDTIARDYDETRGAP